MFCPQCKAEYRAGFTRCSDCDIELVDAANEPPSAGASSDGNLTLLWAGDDLALHTSLLKELKAAQVPYFDRPIGNYSRRAFPNRFPGGATPLFGFEVGVFSSDFGTARAILEKLESGTGNLGEN
jgi:predicted amidophosphoribosyltransferase